MAVLTANFASQFGTNVWQLAQQKGSKLRDKVKLEPMSGEVKYLDRLGNLEAEERGAEARYGKVTIKHRTGSRRALKVQDFDTNDMIDRCDELDMFIDPKSAITESIGYALGRKIDDVIIAKGFMDPAYEGKTGDTVVQFPNSQKIAVSTGGVSNANTGMNIEKLIQARSILGKGDIDLDDPRNAPFMAISQDQLDDLLRNTEVTSSDYNTVKALVGGQLDSFMGFKFVRLQRLATTAIEGNNTQHIRTCVAWCREHVRLALPREAFVRVDELPEYAFNWFVYGAIRAGATRIEDNGIVHLPCLENK